MEIRHGISEIKGELPNNPRRFKRIINMIAIYQSSAQSVLGVDPDSKKWKQLVLWIILMKELYYGSITSPHFPDYYVKTL